MTLIWAVAWSRGSTLKYAQPVAQVPLDEDELEVIFCVTVGGCSSVLGHLELGQYSRRHFPRWFGRASRLVRQGDSWFVNELGEFHIKKVLDCSLILSMACIEGSPPSKSIDRRHYGTLKR